ncbi:MAG: penicillin acylase family protein, partial [Rhizobiales bacterium]|nr:penicillin acylase family protein [Rhizobacter sp.]
MTAQRPMPPRPARLRTASATARRLSHALVLPLLAAACGGDGGDDPDAYTVTRNAHGVPHVQAASVEGAARGLGVSLAEDQFCLIQEI